MKNKKLSRIIIVSAIAVTVGFTGSLVYANSLDNTSRHQSSTHQTVDSRHETNQTRINHDNGRHERKQVQHNQHDNTNTQHQNGHQF